MILNAKIGVFEHHGYLARRCGHGRRRRLSSPRRQARPLLCWPSPPARVWPAGRPSLRGSRNATAPERTGAVSTPAPRWHRWVAPAAAAWPLSLAGRPADLRRRHAPGGGSRDGYRSRRTRHPPWMESGTPCAFNSPFTLRRLACLIYPRGGGAGGGGPPAVPARRHKIPGGTPPLSWGCSGLPTSDSPRSNPEGGPNAALG